MKRTLILTISVVFAISSCGQGRNDSLKKLYLEGGFGPASHNGVFAQIGIRGVLKNNWVASLSFYTVEMDPKNLPADYKQGYTLVSMIPIPDEMPSTRLKLFNVTGGRYFHLGRKTWLTAEAGLSVGGGESFHFTSQQVQTDWFHISSNYSVEKKKEALIGAMVRSDFTWAFSPWVGLSVGGFVNMNSLQSPAGVELKLIAGWLNRERK